MCRCLLVWLIIEAYLLLEMNTLGEVFVQVPAGMFDNRSMPSGRDEYIRRCLCRCLLVWLIIEACLSAEMNTLRGVCAGAC